MTTLNLSSRELRTRRFALLARALEGRTDVALGILTHLWMRCLEDRAARFEAADRLNYIICPPALVDAALNGLLAAGYLSAQAGAYTCLDVAPWIARAEVRQVRARKAAEKSVKVRAKKRAALKKAERQALAAVPKDVTVEAYTEAAMATATRACWLAYSQKYFDLFGVQPVRNAKVNALIKQFCKRVPHLDAPQVLRFFVGHGQSYYAQRMYPLDLAVKDAEGLYAQWRTNRPVTRATMEQFDQAQKLRATLEQGVSF